MHGVSSISRIRLAQWRRLFVLAIGLWICGFGLPMADLARAAGLVVISGGPLPQSVEWGLYPDGCASPSGGTLVACGDYGSFHFGSSATSCVEVTGIESPPVYTAPRPQIVQLPGGPIPRSVGGDLPCVDGSCFGDPGGTTGGEPWIALIDWNTWHGWTTGWSAISMSGLPVHLYSLDGNDLTSFLGPAVSDAHLLVRLCEVAEAIDRQGISAPTVVNMSFGRYFAAGSDAGDGATCDPASLSCQIGGLFDHLAGAGVVATAATGNYGQVQFPAAYDTVLATGSLDLARLALIKKIAASWETPSPAEVLLPGYGVCLETTDGEDLTELWAAPPGSSYASSLFAGWMAHTLLAQPVSNPLDVAWGLSWSDAAGCFVLSEEGPPVCNLAADRLLLRALGGTAETCWTPSPQTYEEVDSLELPVQQGITGRLPSLVEWQEIEHAPTPDSDPCVPCVSDGFNQTVGAGLKGPQRRATDLDLMLDLSDSSAIRPSLTLEELHLRVEDDFHPLLLRSVPEHVARLDVLAAGQTDGLLVRNARSLFRPDQQPSLLFVLCDTGEDCFWISIPVLSIE